MENWEIIRSSVHVCCRKINILVAVIFPKVKERVRDKFLKSNFHSFINKITNIFSIFGSAQKNSKGNKMGCFERFPTVSYCCGCISLEAGAFTLGILKLITSWTFILLAVYQLSNFEERVEKGMYKCVYSWLIKFACYV